MTDPLPAIDLDPATGIHTWLRNMASTRSRDDALDEARRLLTAADLALTELRQRLTVRITIDEHERIVAGLHETYRRRIDRLERQLAAATKKAHR